MASEPLNDLPGSDAAGAGRLAGVQARLDAASPQRGSSLRATVALANAGSGAVDLLNPFDLIQWQLLDDAGAPLEVPSRAPNLMVNRAAAAPWKLDTAVPITEVQRDSVPADAAELDSAAVSLAAGGELAVTYEFGQVLKEGSPVDLAGGEYRLICLATLIDAADTDRSRILRCNPVPVVFERA